MHLAAKDRLIVALDVPGEADAMNIVEQLGDDVGFYKVGLELFTAAGLPLVRHLRAAGKNVFLDLKLFDIGETVKRTVAVAAQQDVQLLTVQGDRHVVRAAVEGRGESPLRVLAVTVLTSLSEEDLRDIGYTGTVADNVLRRARHAREAGADGLIASAQEVGPLREDGNSRLLIVTPGIRPAGASAHDQKRIATPAAALGAGADYLVVGRPITAAPDRRAAGSAIVAEMAAALG